MPGPPKLLGLPVLALTVLSLAIAASTQGAWVLWSAIPVSYCSGLIWAWVVCLQRQPLVLHGALAGALAGVAGQLIPAVIAPLCFRVFGVVPTTSISMFLTVQLVLAGGFGALLGATMVGIMLRESDSAG